MRGSATTEQDKKSGVIYVVLAALTMVFLGSLVFLTLRGEEIGQHEGYSVTVERTAPPEEIQININSASAQELEQLNGIGPALAQAIVNDRTEHGPFASVEELTRVNGIGEAKLDAIRDMVTVGG